MIETTMEIKGLSEIENRLKTMYPKVAKRHVRAAMRDGAKDVVRAAQMIVPQRTQNLGNTLAFVFLKNRTGGKFGLRFGWITKNRKMNAKGKAPVNDGYYGHWVEYGHKIVPRGQAGASRREKKLGGGSLGYGRVAPKPHFQPAWDRMHGTMITKTVDYLKDKVMKEWEA